MLPRRRAPRRLPAQFLWYRRLRGPEAPAALDPPFASLAVTTIMTFHLVPWVMHPFIDLQVCACAPRCLRLAASAPAPGRRGGWRTRLSRGLGAGFGWPGGGRRGHAGNPSTSAGFPAGG